MAVLLGVCNWVHPLLQSPSCCKELKEAGLDAIQLDLGSAEEDFPLSSPGIQRQWKEEAELYGIRLDAVVVLAVLKHAIYPENTDKPRFAAYPPCETARRLYAFQFFATAFHDTAWSFAP